MVYLVNRILLITQFFSSAQFLGGANLLMFPCVGLFFLGFIHSFIHVLIYLIFTYLLKLIRNYLPCGRLTWPSLFRVLGSVTGLSSHSEVSRPTRAFKSRTTTHSLCWVWCFSHALQPCFMPLST